MDRKILAFVHIHKAAGTTLTHILRLNFFLTHFDANILFQKDSKGVFQADEMKKIIKINPFVRCISGHDIKPFSDLSIKFPKIRYITLLRDPIKRSISNYQYNVEKHGSKLSFDEYLSKHWSKNDQTRWIAGSDDISLAKQIISNKFFLVGLVEQFDGFLILLKKKLEPMKFKIGYKQQNVANKHSAIRKYIYRNYNEYEKKIINHNLLDIKLYHYVKNEILPKEKRAYGPTYEDDLEHYKKLGSRFPLSLIRYLDYIYRKCYCVPIIKVYRKMDWI